MNFRLKRTVFSTILFAASAVHTSSYAQATREEIFDNIAVTGGVYYAYPAPGVQTKAPRVTSLSISVTSDVMARAG